MSFEQDEINLTLQIQNTDDDFDAEELDHLTQILKSNLDEVGVESVTLMRDQETPAGAKGDSITIGALLVAVLPATLPKLMDFLQAWVLRHKDQTVKLHFSVKDSSGVERSVDLESPASLSAEELKKRVEAIKPLF